MRTIYVFALIFLAASAMAEVNTKRAGLITKHIYSLIQTGYTVDTVVQLLNALLTVSQANLDELEANWDVTKASLLDNIANIQALDDAQHQHCADISATIDELHGEVKKYVAYIHDAQETLEQNNENLASRLDARCSGNLLYVGHLKSNQDALRLLHFLRDQIANPGFKDYLEGSNGAFVELHQHLKAKKRSTLSILAKHHMLAMITQAYTGESDLGYDLSARSDSEIGSGHVDNDQSAVSVDSFTIDARNLDNFISELLGFVDELIEQIQEDNRRLQAAEFAAVEDLIDYQDQIEADAIVLNRYITLWVGHIEDLQATIEQDEEALDQCEERAEELDAALEAAEEDYDERSAAFEARQESLQHTVDALQEIIDVYVNTVANAAIEYKARFDHEMDQMAEDRRRHQAELEEEERAEIEAQEAADKAASAAAAAESTESEATGPISEWISNQEVLEAEEAVAASLAESTESEEEETESESEPTESESTETESLITIETASATFATFSAPTTEWAPIETYTAETVSESTESVEESYTLAQSWSAAPATETYTESTETAWVAETVVVSESTESEATPVWTPESESSEEEETFEPSTWTYVSASTETVEEVSETAAWSAAVSAAQSTVESVEETSESVSALFADAVAEASVSESTEAVWGAAAASSSTESSAAEGNGWEWNAETAESESTSESTSEVEFVQKKSHLRRRI